MSTFNIEPVNHNLQEQLKHKIDFKTKPLGALGRLEELAMQIGLIQNTLTPVLSNPHLLVFAGDHGIVDEGVSLFPQEVTYQMVYNFLSGGAAINVFCKHQGIKIKVIDAGVNHQFQSHPDLIISKVAQGTANFAKGPAMSIDQAQSCIEKGAQIVEDIHSAGSNIIGFGEMGIGNTTAASALMHVFTEIDLHECVGRGTGLNQESILHKEKVIRNAIAINKNGDTPLEKLATYGGFEIAQMVGAMLKAAELKMVVMVDGFITTSAFLVAYAMDKNIYDYTIFCHQSEEKGHNLLLGFLHAKPLINLYMRLGEGTGCAVTYPIVKMAIAFLNEMASFESAGVSNKEEIPVNA